jgi:hypothetical protein
VAKSWHITSDPRKKIHNLGIINNKPLVVKELGDCLVSVYSNAAIRLLLMEYGNPHLDPDTIMFYTGPLDYPLTVKVTSLVYHRLKETINEGDKATPKETNPIEEDLCIRV